MGRIYFDIMRDSMFEGDGNQKVDTYDSDTDEPDPDIFYRYLKHILHTAFHSLFWKFLNCVFQDYQLSDAWSQKGWKEDLDEDWCS